MSTRLSNTRMHQLWLSLAILLASVTTCPLSLQAEELDLKFDKSVRAKVAVYCHSDGKSTFGDSIHSCRNNRYF